MEREIWRFKARSSKGTEYMIIEYQNFIDASSHQFRDGEVSGLKRLITSDGLMVTYIDPETFKIVDTGETVRKVS